jgi:hypothetical protein
MLVMGLGISDIRLLAVIKCKVPHVIFPVSHLGCRSRMEIFFQVMKVLSL